MERIPFPERLISWLDIAKGVGQVVVESVFRMPHQLASHGDHFSHSIDEPEDTLASQPQLFTSGYAERPMVYADPLHHVQQRTNRWDDCGRDLPEE